MSAMMEKFRAECAKTRDQLEQEFHKDMDGADPKELACASRALEEMFQDLATFAEGAHWKALELAYPNECDRMGHFDAEHDS